VRALFVAFVYPRPSDAAHLLDPFEHIVPIGFVAALDECALIGFPRLDKPGMCSRSWLENSRATRARGLKPSSGRRLAPVHTSAQILTDVAMLRR
jgi:hypothetical protein